MTEQVCPACQGLGTETVLVDYDDGTGREETREECGTCHGRGFVDEDRYRRIVDGKRLQQERVARHETLREAAKRLGISTVELSRIEAGEE